MKSTTLTSITPFLTVNNGKKAVEFYVSAFEAKEINRYDLADGKISSVLNIEGAEFFVGDEEPEFDNLSPDLKSSGVRIILTTTSADKLFAQALKVGASEICPMTTEEDWRIGKLKDPFGHVWEIGYPL